MEAFLEHYKDSNEYNDICALPFPMNVKRKCRDEKRRKYKNHVLSYKERMAFVKNQFHAWMNDVFELTESLWEESFKSVEAYHGSGVLAYFLFLKWMIYFSVATSVLTVFFIMIPASVQPDFSSVQCNLTGSDDSFLLHENCSLRYKEIVLSQKKPTVIHWFKEFVQGTGWMELTPVFIGWYQPENECLGNVYKVPAAYFSVMVINYFLYLAMLVKYATLAVRQTILNSEACLQKYSNIIFCGWDFCIQNSATVQMKQKVIVKELKNALKEEVQETLVKSQTSVANFFLFLTRILVNIIVLAIVCFTAFLIFRTALFTLQTRNGIISEYLPFVIILSSNVIVPQIVYRLLQFERYSIEIQIKVELFRNVIIRVSFILVLMLTLYLHLSCDVRDECGKGKDECEISECWESRIGQQLYKFAILDFLFFAFWKLVIDYLRTRIVIAFPNKVTNAIGVKRFYIATEVLNLIYSQSLCWLGMFYCPLLPIMYLFKYVGFFYLQKFNVMRNCIPFEESSFRAVRIKAIFVAAQLLSYLLCLPALVYFAVEVAQSKGCGPFRISYASSCGTNWFPKECVLKKTISIPEVLLTVITIQCLLVFCYMVKTQSSKVAAGRLQEMLIWEGKRKRRITQKLTKNFP